MASGLFGSGPQSNILKTVQSSYAGMLDAEKQKGVAMREAMGAFGQAIDPKTIGMKKFKKQFAEADWTNPNTYFEASKFISAFDPSGAMSMAQNGMQLQASQAPKTEKQEYITQSRITDDVEFQGAMNKTTGVWTSAGGTGKATGSKVSKQVSGADLNLQHKTNNYTPDVMYNVNGSTGVISSVGKTGKPVEVKGETTTSKEVTEAYGFKAGSEPHKKVMQSILDVDPSITVTEIKAVRTDWNKVTETEREAIKTADEVIDLATLSQLSNDPEQISVVVDRLVSRMFGGSDSKAQSEMKAFRDSGSFSKNIADAAINFLSGSYTKETFEGFKKLAEFTKNRNVVSYNKKLKQATDSYALSKNMNAEQVGTILGEAMQKSSKIPQPTKGDTLVVKGVTLTYVGGNHLDLSNWVTK